MTKEEIAEYHLDTQYENGEADNYSLEGLKDRLVEAIDQYHKDIINDKIEAINKKKGILETKIRTGKTTLSERILAKQNIRLLNSVINILQP